MRVRTLTSGDTWHISSFSFRVSVSLQEVQKSFTSPFRQESSLTTEYQMQARTATSHHPTSTCKHPLKLQLASKFSLSSNHCFQQLTAILLSLSFQGTANSKGLQKTVTSPPCTKTKKDDLECWSKSSFLKLHQGTAKTVTSPPCTKNLEMTNFTIER